MKINLQKVKISLSALTTVLFATQANAQCPIPTSVTASPSVICTGATTSLNATAVGAAINWFTVPSGGSPIGSSASGANFTLTGVNTTTYYAESFVAGTTNFSYTGAMQAYTVPVGVNQVTITAIGAKGGSVGVTSGGLGTSMTGVFTVTPGQTLAVVVGAQGYSATVTSGGGGASGVASGTTPLIVAGGGAGINNSNSYAGIHAVITTSGVVGEGGGGFGAGGVNGSDGGNITWVSNGNNIAYGGRGFNFNNAGSLGANGISPNTTTTQGTWGLGGGGGSVGSGYCNCGGGGGGYSGGGSASYVNASGGGGGSYNAGTNQNNITMAGTGNGTVTIVAGTACTSASRTAVVLTVNPLPTITVNSGSICSGNSFTMSPSGAASYTYQGGNAVVSPTTNTNYTVVGTSSLGCVSSTVTSSVTVNALPLPTIAVNSGSICAGTSFTMVPSGANTYTFQGGNAVVSPTTNATYTVVGTNSVGCVSATFATSSISVTAAPSVSVSGTPSICVGQSATLTASGANSYSWNTGASISSVVVNPTVTTSYTVTGTSSVTGCNGTKTISLLVSPCAGIASIHSSLKGLMVYPIPASNVLTVELNNENKKTVEISDLSGRVIMKASSSNDKITLNVSQLSEGLYFVKVQSDNAVEVIKVIKQ